MLFKISITMVFLLGQILANDDDLSPEGRIHHRRRRPGGAGGTPCVGRGIPQGKTFLDWNFQHIDVDYNHNLNINCGGNYPHQPPQFDASPNKPNRPLLNHFHQGGGGGGGGHGGLLQGLLGGNRPQGVPIRPPGVPGGGIFSQSQSQSQSQGISGAGSGILGSLGSLLIPDGSFFNGQGLGQGLSQGISSLGQGISGFFQNFANSPSMPGRPPLPVNTPTPEISDPDDTIYNDEKPVHEDHDPVVPDLYNKPGQYLVVSNPVFGSYVQDLNFDFNPNRIYRQFNKGVRQLSKLFRR